MFRYHSEDSAEDSKELDESSGDYEGTTARKPYSNWSDKKNWYLECSLAIVILYPHSSFHKAYIEAYISTGWRS